MLTFSSFETLQGGSGNDTFNIAANTTAALKGGDGNDGFNFTANNVVLTGTLDGQGGTDSLAYPGYTGAVTVKLTAFVAGSGFAGTATGLTAGFAGDRQPRRRHRRRHVYRLRRQ